MSTIDSPTVSESGVLPLRDPKMELFSRKICDGMNADEAYRTATGRIGVTTEWAARAGKQWMKECKARINHIMDERAKNFIKADDHIRQMKEKAAMTRSKRPHVDVSTFEGRKQFFQDVCDDYQFNDGIEVTEAINAVKELMKINGDFDRRTDEVAKTDPAMVMAVIARAHLVAKGSAGSGVMEIMGSQKVADAIREYFKLDYVHLVSIDQKLDCVSKSEEMAKAAPVEEKPQKPEQYPPVQRNEI
jgi:hypothetical protein